MPKVRKPVQISQALLLPVVTTTMWAAWKLLTAAQLIDEVAKAYKDTKMTRHLVEVFCGAHQLSEAAAQHGWNAAMYDKTLNNENDILTTVGLAMLVVAIMSLKPKSVCWFGVPCSSWVWISRSGTGRSAARPEGWNNAYTRGQMRLQRVQLCLSCCARAAV